MVGKALMFRYAANQNQTQKLEAANFSSPGPVWLLWSKFWPIWPNRPKWLDFNRIGKWRRKVFHFFFFFTQKKKTIPFDLGTHFPH